MLYAFKLALFKQIWVVLRLNPSKIFSDPPFWALSYDWSPPKFSDPSQAINNDRSLSGKIAIFSKGLVHGFGQKLAIFPSLFFSGNIGEENVFYDILERKSAF